MTTKTEMQRQIGTLLWVSGEMEVSTFEDEGIVDGRTGLLVKAEDGSEFQVVITKNEVNCVVVHTIFGVKESPIETCKPIDEVYAAEDAIEAAEQRGD